MEEQVRKELEKLCHHILGDDSPAAVIDQLTQVQMLYEKLLVLNYLNEAEAEIVSTSGDSEAELPMEKPVEEARAVAEEKAAHPEQAQEPIGQSSYAAKDDFINESPVLTEELKDDKTPEEQGPLLSRLNDIRAGNIEPQSKASINDRLGGGAMKIGLNDRIAFVKHLFNGEQEDYNRVLSQINTFEDFEEAENFLESMVKPDYDWSQKEDYELRFMHLVRTKFGIG